MSIQFKKRELSVVKKSLSVRSHVEKFLTCKQHVSTLVVVLSTDLGSTFSLLCFPLWFVAILLTCQGNFLKQAFHSDLENILRALRSLR